ncbi:fibrinogen alpha chain-like [Pecten maximus]|uniref:fibrinogen alpha chain-like n=1 Tax=Pecten maximus TaxID=6579 RepID=UPI0014586DAA|nr:fibrinogen alpha chain-like [Pecten maximus]
MKNYKKMKSLCLIFLLMTRDVTVLAYEHTFIRLYRVVPEENSVYILNTNIGVPNHLFCANLCQNEECLSFLYDEVDKRCETYTRLIGSGTDEDVNTTAMYFYKHSALSSCSDIPSRYPSGIYQGVTAEDKMYTFFCYFDLTGVQWIVIQRRLNGVVDFHRTWNEYKKGFGDLYGNFWIGKL